MSDEIVVSDTYVQGDTGPDVVYILRQKSNLQPVDLTGATVFFQMRKPDDKKYTVNAQAQILGAPTEGKVSYTWGANDLAVWGIYQIQWQVTFPDFKEITTKDPIYIEVRRQ